MVSCIGLSSQREVPYIRALPLNSSAFGRHSATKVGARNVFRKTSHYAVPFTEVPRLSPTAYLTASSGFFPISIYIFLSPSVSWSSPGSDSADSKGSFYTLSMSSHTSPPILSEISPPQSTPATNRVACERCWRRKQRVSHEIMTVCEAYHCLCLIY